MHQTNLYVKKLENFKNLDLPFYATEQSAGMDLCAAIEQEMVIAPGKWLLVPTGIAIALEPGFEAQIRPRSGLAYKNGISILNTPGTIDADYRGEIKVILMNFGTDYFIVSRGMRIAQMVVAKYETVKMVVVEDLEDTTRGSGGFGSTGTQSSAPEETILMTPIMVDC